MAEASGAARDRVAFIGDAHLDAGLPEVGEFVEFLARLGQRCGRIVLMGDLFDLWIGRPELQQPHHEQVLEALRQLRRQGTVVRYVEGNRDYRIGSAFAGDAFDDVTEAGLVESIGAKRVFAIHGDLVNRSDRQYRRWRRLSRSSWVWALFHGIPSALRQRVALRMERKMRGTNLGFKHEFPEHAVREYSADLFSWGQDIVVLGHFHVERELIAEEGGRILVLPEWKASRRHLEIDSGGGAGFVDS